jgi:hypothetical protein
VGGLTTNLPDFILKENDFNKRVLGKISKTNGYIVFSGIIAMIVPVAQ